MWGRTRKLDISDHVHVVRGPFITWYGTVSATGGRGRLQVAFPQYSLAFGTRVERLWFWPADLQWIDRCGR